MRRKKIQVVVVTYNHEKYIAQAITNALGQQGEFEIEVMVFDDASTDKTREVVMEIANNDDRVKLFTNAKNIMLEKNLQKALSHIDSDYFAFCEGDDFWTNKFKLQEQMNMLEEKHSLIMNYHHVLYFNQETGEKSLNKVQLKTNKDVMTLEDVIVSYPIRNFSSCFYRGSLLDKVNPNIFGMYMADWLFHIETARYGQIGVIRTPMSQYRVHGTSLWSSMTVKEKLNKNIEMAKMYNKFYGYQYNDLFSRCIASYEKDLKAIGNVVNGSTLGKAAAVAAAVAAIV
ncbi:MAG: glycosyltransferase [Lactobacillus sp.]|jgi:glycosyltransferase involved in cell wall biosynthesis|nr:glycosyltransferase [Lactobacillus sp.]